MTGMTLDTLSRGPSPVLSLDNDRRLGWTKTKEGVRGLTAAAGLLTPPVLGVFHVLVSNSAFDREVEEETAGPKRENFVALAVALLLSLDVSA